MRRKPIIIDLTIPADLRFSSGVREFVDEFCIYAHFNHTTSNQLKLIIDELFMNAVRYASGPDSDVVVKLVYKNNLVKGQIEDAGEGKQKTTVEDLEKIILMQTNNNVLTKTSGRGLAQIVKAWTNKMEIFENAKGGLTISFEKEIKNQKKEKEITIDPFLKTPSSDFKEFRFVFEGEISEENIKKNKKVVNDFLRKEHKENFRIVLDFKKLHYCNSLFIGQIADWYNKAKKLNGELVILNPNKDIIDIIDMVGLTKVIPIQNLDQIDS